MASIREIVRQYNEEIQDGIAWVMIWKNGRSWNAEAFWIEDGCYDDGFIFDREAMDRMEEIIKIDPRAVMLNGYYCNCGAVEDGKAPIADIIGGVEWNYYNRYNQLIGFYDSMVVK